MQKLEEMEENELASKIDSIFILLKIIGVALKRWRNPIKIARMLKLSATVQNKIKNIQNTQKKEQQIEQSMLLAEILLDFRRKNPQDFEAIFDTLEDIVHSYKHNDEMKKEIHNLVG